MLLLTPHSMLRSRSFGGRLKLFVKGSGGDQPRYVPPIPAKPANAATAVPRKASTGSLKRSSAPVFHVTGSGSDAGSHSRQESATTLGSDDELGEGDWSDDDTADYNVALDDALTDDDSEYYDSDSDDDAGGGGGVTVTPMAMMRAQSEQLPGSPTVSSHSIMVERRPVVEVVGAGSESESEESEEDYAIVVVPS